MYGAFTVKPLAKDTIEFTSIQMTLFMIPNAFLSYNTFVSSKSGQNLKGQKPSPNTGFDLEIIPRGAKW